ncbi:MAG: tyrosine-type recombinase/integrase, partial [Candidatus Limnocylindria bacterium]
MTALALSAEQERLVARYGEVRGEFGQRRDHVELWGARSFFARFGSIDGWRQAPLERKMAVNVKVHRFIVWLMATQQVEVPADYLVARRPQPGRIVARQHAEFFATFRSTATALGFKPDLVDKQWAALCQACAIHACGPAELTQARLDAARRALIAAGSALGHPMRTTASALFHLEATLFHAKVTDQLPRRRQPDQASARAAEWSAIARSAPALRDTAQRYVAQIALSLRPSTVHQTEAALREFAAFVSTRDPAVRGFAAIGRPHVEGYKAWLAARPTQRGGAMHRHTIRDRLGKLRSFFERIIEWGWDDAPPRVPLFAADFPVADERLPRFIDDAASAKLLIAARAHPDPFTRLTVEFLARTGLRKGEFLALTTDAVVKIGSAFWLRVPIGKLHNDRYIPLHPQLKELLDQWLARRPVGLRSDLVFVARGRPLAASRVDQAVR